MQKGTILVLKGASRYEVLRRAADEVAQGFENEGYKVVTADTTATDFDMSLLTERSYAFIFMIEAFLFDVRLRDGSSLISHINTPWIGWIFDDILYHAGRVLENKYPHVLLFSVDGAADRIVREMGLKLNPIHTLLHGGFEYRGEDPEKDIDVLCPCTVGEEPQWPKDLAPEMKALGQEAVNIYKRALNFDSENQCTGKAEEILAPQLSARQLLKMVCHMHGIEFSGKVLREMSDTVLAVTMHMRYICRKKILEAVISSGLNVHLVGQMSECEIKALPDNVTVHGPMNIDEVVQLTARAKVLVNPFPVVYEEGAHERIFTAMLNHTVCFTPESVYLKRLLGDRVEYINLNNTEALTRKLQEAVNTWTTQNAPETATTPEAPPATCAEASTGTSARPQMPDAGEELARHLEDNYIFARDSHTWSKRGEQLIRLLESE